jgi:hypothetical protein
MEVVRRILRYIKESLENGLWKRGSVERECCILKEKSIVDSLINTFLFYFFFYYNPIMISIQRETSQFEANPNFIQIISLLYMWA